MNSTHSRLADAMRSAQMRITPQKSAIYEALAHSHDHPTAEELYSLLRENFPHLSLGTVYDNLRKFVSLGLCVEVSDTAGATRYDANMENHHHVVDSSTGTITDVYLSANETIPVPADIDPASIKEIRITYIT